MTFTLFNLVARKFLANSIISYHVKTFKFIEFLNSVGLAKDTSWKRDFNMECIRLAQPEESQVTIIAPLQVRPI